MNHESQRLDKVARCCIQFYGTMREEDRDLILVRFVLDYGVSLLFLWNDLFAAAVKVLWFCTFF